MNDHERVLDHLRQAERILVALNGVAAASSKLHSCKIHIWDAMDDIRFIIEQVPSMALRCQSEAPEDYIFCTLELGHPGLCSWEKEQMK